MKNKAKPFRFKQFTIHQDQCAMKVGTDGVLLGAWTSINSDTKTILDIGTGTGLLALMLAQRSPKASITAIEIDHQAAQQAEQNFRNSKWNKQLQLLHTSFQDFSSSNSFDLIVSNPPYFKAEATNSSRELARNQGALALNLLIEKAEHLLKADGKLALVLPTDQLADLKKLTSQYCLYINKRTHVKGNSRTPAKRVLLEISKKNRESIQDELIIELSQRHDYSLDYQNLLKEYLTIFR